jgi:hypothetical protein
VVAQQVEHLVALALVVADGDQHARRAQVGARHHVRDGHGREVEGALVHQAKEGLGQLALDQFVDPGHASRRRHGESVAWREAGVEWQVSALNPGARTLAHPSAGQRVCWTSSTT